MDAACGTYWPAIAGITAIMALFGPVYLVLVFGGWRKGIIKIAVNNCAGAFGLSQRAIERYTEIVGSPPDLDTLARDDATLIRVIEELGPEANGPHAEIKIVPVPEGVTWGIDHVAGLEWVAERLRTW